MKKFSFLRTVLLGAALTATSVMALAQDTYKLVTSTSDLVAGAKYLVASGKSGSVRLLGYQNTNNRPQTTSAVTVSGSVITVTPATVSTNQTAAYEITLSGATGAWVLTDAVNSIILGPSAGAGSNNYLKENAAATFAFTIASTSAVGMKAVTGTNTQGTTGGRNNLRYNTNSGNGLFACYAGDESSTITDTYLFKKEEPTMAVGNVNGSKINLVKNTIVSNEIVFGASAKVSVYNMAGQVVKSAEVAENARLDVSALPKGTYIVTGLVNGQAVSQKVIKK